MKKIHVFCHHIKYAGRQNLPLALALSSRALVCMAQCQVDRIFAPSELRAPLRTGREALSLQDPGILGLYPQ